MLLAYTNSAARGYNSFIDSVVVAIFNDIELRGKGKKIYLCKKNKIKMWGVLD
jgi:hypothetical protein